MNLPADLKVRLEMISEGITETRKARRSALPFFIDALAKSHLQGKTELRPAGF